MSDKFWDEWATLHDGFTFVRNLAPTNYHPGGRYVAKDQSGKEFLFHYRYK
tara:strand:+ start:202 stop:354 length:153 start_codon:yes stop_codon:yes gene_type:complete